MNPCRHASLQQIWVWCGQNSTHSGPSSFKPGHKIPVTWYPYRVTPLTMWSYLSYKILRQIEFILEHSNSSKSNVIKNKLDSKLQSESKNMRPAMITYNLTRRLKRHQKSKYAVTNISPTVDFGPKTRLSAKCGFSVTCISAISEKCCIDIQTSVCIISVLEFVELDCVFSYLKWPTLIFSEFFGFLRKFHFLISVWYFSTSRMLIFVKTDIFTDIHYPSFSLKDTFWATKNELFKI